MGCDILTRLPKVFHDNKFIVSNNKISYSSLNEAKESREENYDLFSYLNRIVSIKLNNGDTYNGKVLSINRDTILLNDGSYININDIVNIK